MLVTIELAFFQPFFLSMTSSLTQIRRKQTTLFCMVPVVHLDHGILHAVTILFCSRSVCGGGFKLPNSRTSEKRRSPQP